MICAQIERLNIKDHHGIEDRLYIRIFEFLISKWSILNIARRLEQLFDKYEISADMTYAILTSFNSLTTFVVTTSYNIGLHSIKSTFQ